MDMILRIDMGAAGGPKAKVEPVGAFAGLGGRGMTSMIVAKEVDPLCHPLSAANKLVIAPGLLTGTSASTHRDLPPTRHCGRGGVGAVMGAKKIKAIIIDEAGTQMRAPKNPEKFKEAGTVFVEGLKKHAVSGQALPPD